MSRAYLIANPKAGKGAAGEGWETLLHALQRAGLEPEGDLTQGPGHALELARQARRDGRGLVVAAGGDGTVHEVVNGLLADGPGDDVPELGIVPVGTGCDYVKTFDIPHEMAGAVARIAAGAPPRFVDVGRVTYQTPAGEAVRYFANIAEAGIGAVVVDRARTLPRWLGPSVYFFAFWMRLPGFRRPSVVVETDGERWEGVMINLVVANATTFGGGMRVAPGADPSDGLFDVQIHAGTKIDYVTGIPKVYKGTHLPHPRIIQRRAARVTVRANPETVVEADGEVLGRTPATFEIVPRALRLRA